MENIRVIEKIGKSPGKNIVILAGVHGNEVCGVKAFNELIPELEIEKGKVTFIYANLEAQKQNKRFVEYNLNRCFLDEQPNDMSQTLEGRTATAIMEYLNEADLLLDLHSSPTAGKNNFLICEEDCLDLIKCLSPRKVIIGIDKIQKGGTDGYMFNKGKQGICVECGSHESKESILTAKESILNFLRNLNAIKGSIEKFDDKELYRTKYMYISKNGDFNLKGNFNDFHQFNKRTLIGTDGDEEIFIEKEDIIMFPKKFEAIGKECFVILKKIN